MIPPPTSAGIASRIPGGPNTKTDPQTQAAASRHRCLLLSSIHEISRVNNTFFLLLLLLVYLHLFPFFPDKIPVHTVGFLQGHILSVYHIGLAVDGDLHLEILSHLMVLLMNPDFVKELREAKDAEAFMKIIDRYETEKYGGEEKKEEPKTAAPEKKIRSVLAVTACPTGSRF